MTKVDARERIQPASIELARPGRSHIVEEKMENMVGPREDLNLDCSACWASVCSAHGPVPPVVKVRTLVLNYGHLAARFEEARRNLANVPGMSDTAEMADLVSEVAHRLRKPDTSGSAKIAAIVEQEGLPYR